MAVWIDENGVLVRPAEAASIERSPLRDMEIPEGLPEQLSKVMQTIQKTAANQRSNRKPRPTRAP